MPLIRLQVGQSLTTAVAVRAGQRALVWLAVLAVGIVAPAQGDDGRPARASDRAEMPLVSGLQVGEKVPQFYVRAVTGPLKNRSVCYVCRHGDRPVVMVLAREVTAELQDLLQGIDQIVDQNRASGLKCFGVFMAENSGPLLPAVQTLSFNAKLSVPLTVAAAPDDGPPGQKIHPAAAVTIVLYRNTTVEANFAYRAGELTGPQRGKVLASVRRLANLPPAPAPADLSTEVTTAARPR